MKQKAYRVRISGEVIMTDADSAQHAKDSAPAVIEGLCDHPWGSFFIEPGALIAGRVRRAPEYDRTPNEMMPDPK